MESIRKTLCTHLETARAFVLELLKVDSGAYRMEELGRSLLQPDATIRMETKWLQDLLHVLQVIERYTTLVDRWVKHVLGLAMNLGATPEEIIQLERQEISAEKIVQSKSFEKEYLQWVLADVAQEVDRLIAATQDLESQAIELINLTEQFGGPFFTQVGRIAGLLVNTARQDFYTPIIEILDASDVEPEAEVILQRLCKYLDTIDVIVSSTPLFIDEEHTITYSPEAFEETRKRVNQLIQGMKDLRKFVSLRSEAYLLLLNEQQALLQAVLPSDTNVTRWIASFGIDTSKSADDMLPKLLITDTLPLAIQQAEDAISSWSSSIEAAIPYLNKALILNEFLKSPAVEKFLSADQRRLQLYQEWKPQITRSFEELKNIVIPPKDEE